MNKLLIFIAVPLLQLFFLQKTFADDFKLVKQQNSISLYERWVRHNGGQVRELKAEFIISSGKAKDLELLLKNEPQGLLWNNNASRYKVIPGKLQDSWRVYIQYDTPWPMDDFDCLLAYRYEKAPPNGSIAEISFKSTTSDQFPVSANITRITGTTGKWMLENQGEHLKVTYLVTTDRSRKVPRWISDPIVHENLFKTMTKFKELLED